jgi:hypothetical protein
VSGRLDLAASSAGGQTQALSDDLREKVDAIREIPGCPTGSDDAILTMSTPPAHTACPNPYVREWVEQNRNDEERRDPGPFASDSQAGKTSLVYRAHAFPTKVPPEAIMRLILHYTQPGDIVLDGFCGTGMTGVAAQMCGTADTEMRQRIKLEMGHVKWGARKAVLQDLGPSATFIAAGLNLPVDADSFDRASAEMLDRFDDEYGWMYETELEDGRMAQIDYTVWSQVMTCPHCGSAVIFYEAAFDPTTERVKEKFACPSCGAGVSKRLLERRKRSVTVIGGERVERTEFRPVAIAARSDGEHVTKAVEAKDEQIIDRCKRLDLSGAPHTELPYLHMTHERSRVYADGFTNLNRFYTDRALATLAALWAWVDDVSDLSLRHTLRFWVEQAFWSFSYMNRYRPDAFSQTGQFQSGVYYIASLHAEPSLRYGLEGARPTRGKRANLVKLWSTNRVHADNVRISTGSSTVLDVPDDSVDYVFVDPPFGENIYYSDLAFLTEAWHGVLSDPMTEAIVDRNKQRPKTLLDYSDLIEACFREFHRVLKPGRWMTVEFSNSSNAVWSVIQQALASAGFVVADTRVLDKEQHSFRQVTAKNAVKSDLIISAYKPHTGLAEEIRLAGGSEDGVWAFVREHLSHLPIQDLIEGVPRVVRSRQPDRLYDRMAAFHVAQGIVVPVTAAQFYAGLESRFLSRDHMFFLPRHAEEYERLQAEGEELDQPELFITGETSAVEWLRQLVGNQAFTYAEIQPEFFQEVQKGTLGWDQLPDLKELLDQNFVIDELGRYKAPDPQKAGHLEQLRDAELMKVFDGYVASTGLLEPFRSEAVKAGFKKAYRDRDFETITKVGKRLPIEAFNDDTALLHYFRNAERLQRGAV